MKKGIVLTAVVALAAVLLAGCQPFFLNSDNWTAEAALVANWAAHTAEGSEDGVTDSETATEYVITFDSYAVDGVVEDLISYLEDEGVSWEWQQEFTTITGTYTINKDDLTVQGMDMEFDGGQIDSIDATLPAADGTLWRPLDVNGEGQVVDVDTSITWGGEFSFTFFKHID